VTIRARLSLACFGGDRSAEDLTDERPLATSLHNQARKVVHRRVFAPAIPERDKLIVEIAGRLSRQAGEILIIRALTLRPMTRRAGKNASGDRVRRPINRLRRSCARMNDEEHKARGTRLTQ
jgi:hypothetical protein